MSVTISDPFFLLYTRNKLSFIVCCCLSVGLYHQIFTTAVAANRISASFGRTNVHSARRKKCLRHLCRFSKTKLLKTDILHMTVINFIRLSWKQKNKTYWLVFNDYFPWLGCASWASSKYNVCTNSLNYANHLNYKRTPLIMTKIKTNC